MPRPILDKGEGKIFSVRKCVIPEPSEREDSWDSNKPLGHCDVTAVIAGSSCQFGIEPHNTMKAKARWDPAHPLLYMDTVM